MKYTFFAKSSSGLPYNVVFEDVDGRMTVHCGCKAGELNQQCKHKRALASGDCEMLFDQSQSKALYELMAMPETRYLMAYLKSAEETLALLEKEKSRLAAEEKAIKRKIGELFAGKV